jgi:hypothetical protein
MALLNGGESHVAGFFKGHFVGIGAIIAVVSFSVPILLQLGRDEQELHDLRAIVDARASLLPQVADLKRAVDDLNIEVLNEDRRIGEEREYGRSATNVLEQRENDIRSTVKAITEEVRQTLRDLGFRQEDLAIRVAGCAPLPAPASRGEHSPK